jgi:hypothetical protein
MKKNVGTTDALIRGLVALIIVVLYYFKVIEGTLGIVGLVIAAIFVFTVFFNFCPIYAIFGINTCSVNTNKSKKITR